MFPFIDYKVINSSFAGGNTSNLRLIYTTEYPCILFLEIEAGQIAGFNGGQSCYFNIQYTGDSNPLVTTYIWTAQGTSGSNPGYCQQAGVPVIFNTGDDDFSGAVRLHIMRLPTSRQVQG